MKQFQLRYEKDFALTAWFQKIRGFCDEHHTPAESVLFRIYSDTIDAPRLKPLTGRLQEAFPGSPYAGVTSTGNILHGGLTATHITITCTVLEDSGSRVQVLQLPMNRETQDASADSLIRTVSGLPWVKAIELMSTLSDLDIGSFCEKLSELPEHICLYGGGAHANDIPDGDTRNTFVFSSKGEIARNQAVFLLFGGPDLHFSVSALSGWRELGHPFESLRTDGRMLTELNGQPAADVYQNLLHIPEDSGFFRLANVFPLKFEEDGTSYMRVVISPDEKRSLKLASDTGRADRCIITYGDPIHILNCLEERLMQIREFSPQSILLFSCVTRKYFWGSAEVSRETFPFEALAPTSGFYTSGEFLRTGKKAFLHNITLIIAAMREGAPDEEKRSFLIDRDLISRQMMAANCLASYINSITR